MKAERNAKQKTKFFVFIAEAHPILGEAKDSANRAEYETKDEVFCFYSRGAAYLRHAVANIVKAEDKAKQNTKFLFCFVEVQPILGEAKDSENRAEYETKYEVFCFYSRGAAYLRHAVAKIVQTEDKAKQKTVTMYKKTNTNHTNYTNDAQYLFV